jgi:hypothetical protein
MGAISSISGSSEASMNSGSSTVALVSTNGLLHMVC